MHERIEEGMMTFVSDGGEAVGAVRQVRPGEIVVYVENAGDFVVAMKAVTGVHFQKVMLDAGGLSPEMRAAIGHQHDAEDPASTSSEGE